MLLLPQMRLSNEWRGGLAFVAASLRFDNATFVFEIRDDRTLLPFYNRAFSHAFARIFFHLSRETTIPISLIQFLLNLAYINSFEKRIREKKNIESCSRVLVGE